MFGTLQGRQCWVGPLRRQCLFLTQRFSRAEICAESWDGQGLREERLRHGRRLQPVRIVIITMMLMVMKPVECGSFEKADRASSFEKEEEEWLHPHRHKHKDSLEDGQDGWIEYDFFA